MESPQVRPVRRNRADPAAIAGLSGRTPLQVGDHNLRVTLEAVRRAGPLTRLELGYRTGLTAPGLTNILRRLSDDGLVTARRRSGGPGQPSTEFAIDPDGAFAVGLRLRGSLSEAVLVDLAGEVRERLLFDAGTDLIATIRGVLAQLAGWPARSRNLLGVGIGAKHPGAVDAQGLAAALTPLRVLVERDCIAGALAERMLGVGPVDGGLVLIVIDDVVRAGLLLRGVPFGGVHGRAGDIGAMRTGPDHVPLSSVIGIDALRARLTPAERASLAANGELPLTPAVSDWIGTVAGHLLDAIVAMAGFVAPGAILIGGDLPRNAVEALIARMSVERGDTEVRPIATPWISPIRPSSFTGAGIAIGAALLPFFDLLLPPPTATA